MGVAGGLVPSPSALVVLLGAIGLGRTWFGILLVIGYGVGMAGMLTAVGLILVRLRNRMGEDTASRFSAHGRRWTQLVPTLTAVLVLVVGVSLAVRAAVPLLS
jgi:nickel/cobalt exporter